MGLSFTHLLIVLVIVILLFGTSKLPEFGSGIGKAIKGFKRAMSEPEEIDVSAKKKDEPPTPPKQ